MTREEAIDRIKGWEKANQNFIGRPERSGFERTEEMLNYFRQNSEIYNMCIEALSQPEQKKGKWEVVSDGYGNGETTACICECSECKDTIWVYKKADRKWNFCPYCGAKMGEE